MLPRAAKSRLCRSCRTALLHIFEHGFGPAAAWHAPQRQIRRSCSPFPLHGPKTNRGFVTARGSYDSETPESEPAQDVDEVLNPIEAVRKADGSVEEIVREARQLHGEYLPEGVLSESESKTYRRLYGDPAVPVDTEENLMVDGEQQQLLSKDGDAISYETVSQDDSRGGRIESSALELDWGNTEEMDERAKEAAEHVGGQIRPYEVDQATEEAFADRSHPMTIAGRFETSPRTSFLPQNSFVRPVQKILSDYSNKHLKEMSERLFGGSGLPNSPLTPQIGRALPQKPIPLDASQHTMGVMEANAYVSVVWPSTYAAVSSVLVESRKRLGSRWLRELLAKEGGPSILDAGGGGVAVLAWRDILQAEWYTLHSSDASPPPPPLGRSTVLTGAESLRHRAANLLEQTTFLPRLPDYVHVRDTSTLSDDRPATQRKQFDVIIAPHTLWSLKEEWQRKQQVQNLWSLLNPDGGLLVILEKGVPRGFEVVAGAREFLLSRYIATPESPTYESRLESPDEDGTLPKGKGTIVAPCTNHFPCPMYVVPGVSHGRKSYCAFQQRYIRPPFLQRILEAKDRNHDDVDFSYIAVQKGRDLQDLSTAGHPVAQGKAATDSAFEGYEDTTEQDQVAHVNTLTLPRLVLPPLKRPGHVTMDVCTPAGRIDRWTVSKSFSKTAYRDARKASWGDLWALGAKTRVPRNLQLGGEHSRKARNRDEKMQEKAGRIYQQMSDEREADREVEAEMEKVQKEEEVALASDMDPADVDAEAAEVLREIEMEKKVKMKEREREKKKTSKRKWVEKEAPPRTDKPIGNEHSSSSSSSSSTRAAQQPQPTDTSQNRTIQSLNNPDHSNTGTNLSPSSSNLKPNSNPHPDLDFDLETVLQHDYAAESRADALRSRANRRLRGNAALMQMGRRDLETGPRRSPGQEKRRRTRRRGG